MKGFSDRHWLYLMDLVCAAALFCYTVVLALCHWSARNRNARLAAWRRRMAFLAHSLDWLMNVLVLVKGIGRLFRDEHFGGQYQPRWVKVYLMITGPLPTVAMVGAMMTGKRWEHTLSQNGRQRTIHRTFGLIGYVAWWLSLLPIFLRPWLNRQRDQQRTQSGTAEIRSSQS